MEDYREVCCVIDIVPLEACFLLPNCVCLCLIRVFFFPVGPQGTTHLAKSVSHCQETCPFA